MSVSGPLSRIEVLKFGGTSVANLERIENVARLVEARVRPGLGLAVVVSAMAGETNKLVEFARGAAGGVTSGPGFDDEYDVVVAAGEQVTCGLLALALRRRGLAARSWLGWQMPLRTDFSHGKARITDVEGDALRASMAAGEIAVIAGFQGVDAAGRVATLGRGGSDTSAVAVAAALKADLCDIYTDVDGVYTTDPRIVPEARRLPTVSYEEMLELASLGAKVLQTRSVEMAMNCRVPVRVLSSFVEPGSNDTGTLMCDESGLGYGAGAVEISETRAVTDVAYNRDQAKLTLLGVRNTPGVSARIFGALADVGVNVDIIVQAESRSREYANLIITVEDQDCDRALEVLRARSGEIGIGSVEASRDVCKVSMSGVGLKSQLGVATAMFGVLAREQANIACISTSETKISVLIDKAHTESAVRALMSEYGVARSFAEDRKPLTPAVDLRPVSGVAYSRDEAKVTLYGVQDRPGVASRIFSMLSQAGINVDMIAQSHARQPGEANMVFTVTKADLKRAVAMLEAAREDIGIDQVASDTQVCKVSVVGLGMRNQQGVARRMFEALAARNINVEVTTTSEITISVLLAADYTELAVRALHTAFGLDAEG
jgi:aspartate kinase